MLGYMQVSLLLDNQGPMSMGLVLRSPHQTARRKTLPIAPGYRLHDFMVLAASAFCRRDAKLLPLLSWRIHFLWSTRILLENTRLKPFNLNPYQHLSKLGSQESVPFVPCFYLEWTFLPCLRTKTCFWKWWYWMNAEGGKSTFEILSHSPLTLNLGCWWAV